MDALQVVVERKIPHFGGVAARSTCAQCSVSTRALFVKQVYGGEFPSTRRVRVLRVSALRDAPIERFDDQILILLPLTLSRRPVRNHHIYNQYTIRVLRRCASWSILPRLESAVLNIPCAVSPPECFEF